MEKNKTTLSIVIPVYNSSKTINEVYRQLVELFDRSGHSWELILINDGSQDGSWEVIRDLHRNDPRIKSIGLARNFGQHNAIICGFSYAKGSFIITMDDDLQNPPEEVLVLIKTLEEGDHDVVYGNFTRKKHNIFRNLGSSFIQNIYKKIFRLKKNFTSFRIIKKEVVQNILKYENNFVFIDGLIAMNTRNIGSCTVKHVERKEGKSGYNLRKLLQLAFNMISNFSLLPLQIASFFGFSFAGLGFILSIYYFVRKFFFNVPIQGYTSLIVAVTIFSGVQLITLGIIGEYIGRIHLNINKTPQFIVKDEEI